jgi:D-arabinose 5-phosphate isomerase GutQ
MIVAEDSFEPIDVDIHEKALDWQVNNLNKNLESWGAQREEIELFSAIITSSIPHVGAHKILEAKGRSFNLGADPFFRHSYFGNQMNSGKSIVLTYERDETPSVVSNDVRVAFSVSGTTDETWYGMDKASKVGAILCCVTADLYPDNPQRSIPELCRESWEYWVKKTGYKWDHETYPIIKLVGKREDTPENSYARRQITGRVVPLTPMGTAGENAEFLLGNCLAVAHAEQLKKGKDEIDFDTFMAHGKNEMEQLRETQKYLFSDKELVSETFDHINNTHALLGKAGGLSLAVLKSFIMRMNHLKNNGRYIPKIHGEYGFRIASIVDDPVFSFKDFQEKIRDGTYLGLTLSNDSSYPTSGATIDFARRAKDAGYKLIALTSNNNDEPDHGILKYADIPILLPSIERPLLDPRYKIRNYLGAMLFCDSGVPAILESRGLEENDMWAGHR